MVVVAPVLGAAVATVVTRLVAPLVAVAIRKGARSVIEKMHSDKMYE